MAIGIGVDAERRCAAPEARRAAIARIPEPQPDVEDAGAGEHARGRRAPRRRQAEPGRRVEAGPEGHARVEREDDVVGLAAVAPPGRPDDEPPADPQDREVRLPGLGPVRLVDEPRPELADRPQPERLEVAERLGDLGDGPVRGRAVARRAGRPGRSPAASGRPGRRDPRRPGRSRLDGRAAGRDPAEDLADRLDRLDVGLDRELEPGARGAVVRSAAASPEPELLAQPAAAEPTCSPVSSAYVVEQLARRFLESLVGTTTSTRTCRSPREPGRRRWGTPLPRRRISVSGWVPGLISTSSSPSTVGTVIRVPSAAWAIETSAS